MKLNDEEIYELFRAKAKEDYGTDDDKYDDLSEYEKARIYAAQKRDIPFPIGDTSSTEYVSWMANVWRLNDERNKMIDEQKKANDARAKYSRGTNPRVTKLKGNNAS